jgi:hypothetical protein
LIVVVTILRDVLITRDIVKLSTIDAELAGVLEEWHTGCSWQWWCSGPKRLMDNRRNIVLLKLDAEITAV